LSIILAQSVYRLVHFVGFLLRIPGRERFHAGKRLVDKGEEDARIEYEDLARSGV
jgi:hypothetical protein